MEKQNCLDVKVVDGIALIKFERKKVKLNNTGLIGLSLEIYLCNGKYEFLTLFKFVLWLLKLELQMQRILNKQDSIIYQLAIVKWLLINLF
jgi:hypothetical protein